LGNVSAKFKELFFYKYWKIFVTLLVLRMFIDKSKEPRTTLKTLPQDKYFFFIKNVYFGVSEGTALIKNHSDIAYSLYTIQYTEY